MIRVERTPKSSRKRSEPKQEAQSNSRGLLKSYVERIEAIKSQQDDWATDIRDIYAEAHSNGFDKTAIGQVVTIRRKRAKDPAKFIERNAIVEIYLAEIEDREDRSLARAHTRVREEADQQASTTVGMAASEAGTNEPDGRSSDASPSPIPRTAGEPPEFLVRNMVAAAP